MIKAVVYSNVFVALVLALLTSSTYFNSLNLTFSWVCVAFIFLGSFILYTFHRLYKIDFIAAEDLAERHKWVVSQSNRMKLAMVGCVALVMILLPSFDQETIVWIVPAAIVSIGYTIPVLPSKTGWVRFRDLPLTKPIIIALVVSYLTLAFPTIHQIGIEGILDAGFFFLFSERMLFLLAMTIPFDMRDMVSDKGVGLETLATQYGLSMSKKLSAVCLILWFITTVFLQYQSGWVVLLLITAQFAVGFLSIWSIQNNWKELKYTLVFEGQLIGYALVVILSDLLQRMA